MGRWGKEGHRSRENALRRLGSTAGPDPLGMGGAVLCFPGFPAGCSRQPHHSCPGAQTKRVLGLRIVD